jgi:uncharacterized repeat protein (TIGR01451 family)
MQVSKQCFTWLLYVLPYLAAAQSPFWERTYPQPINSYPAATVAFDSSGFMMAGSYTIANAGLLSSVGLFFKTNRQGDIRWMRSDRDTMYEYRMVKPTFDSGYIMLAIRNNPSLRSIHKINKLGVKQWSKEYYSYDKFIISVVTTRDSGYMILGCSDSMYLNKLDASGNSLWIKKFWKKPLYREIFDLSGLNLIELPNGGFVVPVCKGINVDSNTVLVRTNALGDLSRIIVIGDPNILYMNHQSLNVQDNKVSYMAYNQNAGYFYQLDLQSGAQRVTPFPDNQRIWEYNLAKRRSGGYWLSYPRWDSTGNVEQHLWRLNPNGVPVSHKTFPSKMGLGISHLTELSDTTLLFCGSQNSNAFMMVTDTNGFAYRNLIRGDLSSSCTNAFANWAVSATRADGTVFHTRTDTTSRFEIAMDTGNYTIRAHPPTDDWSSNVRTLSQPNRNRIDTIPLIINCLTNCPNLNVDVTTPILRRCFPNEQTIRYCNNGTATAVNAYVEVKLDSLLEYLSSSLPLASRIGQTLRFNLGTIEVNRCHDFTVQSRVRCGDSTQLGQSLCTNVHIYPDTICANLPNWTGAHLNVSGTCERDSVRFTIANLGRGNSSSVRRTVVDNAHLMSSTLTNLAANGQQTLRFPANGHTWRVSVEQEPNHPYANTPTAVVEGCRTNANTPISTLFLNQLPLDTRNPVQKTVCTTLIGSYDPNDKTSLPVGYGVNRLIEANQDIEYMVRFQNTGTDTAFTVVVKDTLSNLLDALSIQPLASSHRYEWTVLKNNILQFTFPNIQLVDSFHNEPKSHGFIKFHIKQKPNVALGSTISNQAAIYFDFNAPVITNRTQLTIGKQFIVAGVSDETSKLRMRLVTYPNPTIDHAILEILDGNDDASNRHFQMLDATGRVVREGHFNGNRYEFSREGLNAGFYVFRVAQQGQLLGMGRIVIQ